MIIKKLKHNPRFKYILLTFVVSGIGFIKTFIILKTFDFVTLGLIALMLNFATSISLFQFGVVTGGYRLFSYKKENVLKKINANIFTYFLLLSLVLLLLALITSLVFDIEISVLTLLSFIAIGVVSLYSNWVTCKLLATNNTGTLNKAQIVSTIISLILVICAKWVSVLLVFFSFLLQPLVLIGMSYYVNPELKPSIGLGFSKKMIRIIISLGFIPYLTTALKVFNSQLGRWLITISLGTIILGKTFLAILFVTLVGVFPGAISNLYFPEIIKNYENGSNGGLNATLKKHILILFSYFVAVSLITILLGSFIVKTFLPKHIVSINLVYAILPSLFFINMSNPFLIYFNAAKKFNQILFGGLISVFCYVVLVLFCYFLKEINLIDFFIIESISGVVFFCYNLYFFIKFLKPKIYE